MIIYLNYVKPFDDKFINNLEIFNEICVMSITYLLFVFTQFVDLPEIQYLFGWIILAMTSFNIGVNMIIICIKGGR